MAPMHGDFDIQQALTDMETRIRQDIQAVALVSSAAQTAATKLEGRVTSLEEKADWAKAGFGATILGGLGFIWHVIVAGKG